MANEIGVIGLGVMGRSLALNMVRNEFKIALYNRPEPEGSQNLASDLIEQNPEFATAEGFNEIRPFVTSLVKPRKVLLMIKADAVDFVLDELLQLLDPGDVVIEGGNSHYKQTQVRFRRFEEKGIHYLGCGISGGEEGALKGPSIMLGGSSAGFGLAKGILKTIAAKDKDDKPCMAYIGPDGSGHFVKMVHNGIEYGEMQLIADVYSTLRKGLGFSNEQIAEVFESWQKTELQSYLLGITVIILRTKLHEEFVVDKILDVASGKGTGSWTVEAAAELGVPVPTIAAALFARFQSSFNEDRRAANEVYRPANDLMQSPTERLKNAYQVARIINHHQGFHLIITASKYYKWKIDLSSLARIWTKGCIIQSTLMEGLVNVFNESSNLLLSIPMVPLISEHIPDLRTVIQQISGSGIAAPALYASLSYFDAFVETDSSANIIQAQRDYFGAHTFQWKKDLKGEKVHFNWKN